MNTTVTSLPDATITGTSEVARSIARGAFVRPRYGFSQTPGPVPGVEPWVRIVPVTDENTGAAACTLECCAQGKEEL